MSDLTRLFQKVQYVTAEAAKKNQDRHHCHWPGCKLNVPPAKWGCKRHWFMLPQRIRSLIWQTFKPGQEKTKTPSAEYVAVAREAQDWIKENYPNEETR